MPLVARFEAQLDSVDVVLEAGNGSGHFTGGDSLADQDIYQPILIKVISGLQVGERFIGGYDVGQVTGQHCIAQGFVELLFEVR
ncbi:hypothetical protein OC610_05805 [Pseudomonas sp. SAICEU22]|uniref:Uncharacterized protein n=1 Tax=Pseudomonas agronomica TaxID=2979328 RepID=A0ABT3F4C5_9PSED|nr:hypothetical protein [Pseudomonas agronomica]MCW1243912.1 hypothetical protein [Pseudomonas agronomica]